MNWQLAQRRHLPPVANCSRLRPQNKQHQKTGWMMLQREHKTDIPPRPGLVLWNLAKKAAWPRNKLWKVGKKAGGRAGRINTLLRMNMRKNCSKRTTDWMQANWKLCWWRQKRLSLVSPSATDAFCIFNRLDWLEQPAEWEQRSARSSYHGKAKSGQSIPSLEADR